MNRKILSFALSGLAGLFATNCDTFDQDVKPEIVNATIFATKNGLGVVDLERSFVGWDYKSLTIVESPLAGDLNISGKRLTYVPRQGSVSDRFTANISAGGRVGVIHGEIIPTTDPCEKEPITYVSISKNSSLTIDLLDNKDFCGYARAGGMIGTCQTPGLNGDTNQAIDIAILSDRGLSNFAVFTYVPKTDFVGQYRISYTIAADDVSDEPAGSEAWCTDPSRSDYYSHHELVIDVQP